MKKLDLYYYDECPYCQIVLRAIKDARLEAHVQLKNTMDDPANREFHKRTTGRTTVPCLYVDGVPMFESRDIAAWLTDYAKKLK